MTGYREFGIGDGDEGIKAPPPPRLRRKLTVELVPATSWGHNLRSELPPARWDRLRKATYTKAGYICEICGGKGPKHPVECHERWSYNRRKHIQKLLGLEALCPACHGVRHIGHTLSVSDAAFNKALKHLAKVNGWDRKKALSHVDKALVEWQARSEHQWTLDLTWLQNAGL